MSTRHETRRGVQAIASQIYVTNLGIDWNRLVIILDLVLARRSLENDASGDKGVRYGWRRRTSNSSGGDGAAYKALHARPMRRITVPMNRSRWISWSTLCSPPCLQTFTLRHEQVVKIKSTSVAKLHTNTYMNHITFAAIMGRQRLGLKQTSCTTYRQISLRSTFITLYIPYFVFLVKSWAQIALRLHSITPAPAS